MNNRGFTLIEVLLSLIILTVAVVSINAAFKQFTVYKSRFNKYKNIYMTTLSIKDLIESKKLSNNMTGSGKLNGLKYKYRVSLVAKGNTVSTDEESQGSIGKGNFELYLYKIDLQVENKKYSFYKTEYKKVKNFEFENIKIPGK